MSKSCFTIRWKVYDNKEWKVKTSWTVAGGASAAINRMKNEILGENYLRLHKAVDFTARLSTREEMELAASGKTYFHK
jgi:hypothetical protein